MFAISHISDILGIPVQLASRQDSGSVEGGLSRATSAGSSTLNMSIRERLRSRVKTSTTDVRCHLILFVQFYCLYIDKETKTKIFLTFADGPELFSCFEETVRFRIFLLKHLRNYFKSSSVQLLLLQPNTLNRKLRGLRDRALPNRFEESNVSNFVFIVITSSFSMVCDSQLTAFIKRYKKLENYQQLKVRM